MVKRKKRKHDDQHDDIGSRLIAGGVIGLLTFLAGSVFWFVICVNATRRSMRYASADMGDFSEPILPFWIVWFVTGMAAVMSVALGPRRMMDLIESMFKRR